MLIIKFVVCTVVRVKRFFCGKFHQINVEIKRFKFNIFNVR